MCGLALVYGSTFLSIFQFFPWVAKAVSVISCSFPASSSAELPPEWPGRAFRLSAECVWRPLAKAERSCLAQSQPKPHTCAWVSVRVPELQPEVPAHPGGLIPEGEPQKGAGHWQHTPTGAGALVLTPCSLPIHGWQGVLGLNSGFCSHAIINEMREMIILHFAEPF